MMDATAYATEGVYPVVRTVQYADTGTMLADGVTLSERLAEVLTQPRQTDRDLRRLLSDLSAIGSLASALRVKLDAWKAVDVVFACDASDQLAAWRWERALRAQLVRLTGLIQDTTTEVIVALQGRRQRTALVRSGDTWQGLAQTHLGTWERWPELVDLNDASPIGPTVGSEILIPER